MDAIDAVGKVAGGIRDADGSLSHKIRLSDFTGTLICDGKPFGQKVGPPAR
jgi:hypothetical protein